MLRTTAAIAASLLITAGSLADQGFGLINSTVPPSILKQMNPDLVADARPKFVVIKQEDIFELKDKPRVDADFVRFNFEVSGLSTAQRKVLTAWARAGNNKIMLVADDIIKYTPLFGLEAGGPDTLGPAKQQVVTPEFNMAEHPVSTDCKNLTWGIVREMPSTTTGEKTLVALRYYIKTNDPKAMTVLVSPKSERLEALCGAFAFGRTTVYFHNLASGPDGRRWLLNFYHWALDLPIPGASEAGAPANAVKDSAAK